MTVQANKKAAAEASARREEEQQREAERKAALKERADSYKAQEASRLQVEHLLQYLLQLAGECRTH